MSKGEILDELPPLTKIERQEIRLRLAELDSKDWLDDEDLLTVHEKAVLEARLAAYAKDPDAGSTWGDGGRIQARLSASQTNKPAFNRQAEEEADITDAAVWYESRASGFGLELLSEVNSAIARAESLTCSPKSNGSSYSHSTISLSRFLH
jgi:hypothetical protein